jgi:hypothetical protein
MPNAKPSEQQSGDELMTIPTLKARGWTETLIRQYLGAPDSSCPNPYYRSAAPMRLYARARVEAVEASPAWPTLQEQVARRKAAAAKAVETKTQRLWDYLDELEITVPVMPCRCSPNRPVPIITIGKLCVSAGMPKRPRQRPIPAFWNGSR